MESLFDKKNISKMTFQQFLVVKNSINSLSQLDSTLFWFKQNKVKLLDSLKREGCESGRSTLDGSFKGNFAGQSTSFLSSTNIGNGAQIGFGPGFDNGQLSGNIEIYGEHNSRRSSNYLLLMTEDISCEIFLSLRGGWFVIFVGMIGGHEAYNIVSSEVPIKQITPSFILDTIQSGSFYRKPLLLKGSFIYNKNDLPNTLEEFLSEMNSFQKQLFFAPGWKEKSNRGLELIKEYKITRGEPYYYPAQICFAILTMVFLFMIFILLLTDPRDIWSIVGLTPPVFLMFILFLLFSRKEKLREKKRKEKEQEFADYTPTVVDAEIYWLHLCNLKGDEIPYSILEKYYLAELPSDTVKFGIICFEATVAVENKKEADEKEIKKNLFF